MSRHLKSLLSSFSRHKEAEKAEDQKESTAVRKSATDSQPTIKQHCSSKIFEPKDLWQTAFDQLDDKQQQILSRAQPESKDQKAGSSELINDIIQVTTKQYKEYQQKSDKAFRKASRKIIDSLLSYSDFISAAAGLDPTQHAASAWAVVSLSLRTAQNHHDARNALFESSEYLAEVMTQCAFIERKFYVEGHPDIRGHVEAAMVNLYKAILRYSGQIWSSQQSGIGRNFSDCFTAITGHPLTQLQTSVEKERDGLRRWVELGGYLHHEKEAENMLLKIDELGESLKLLLEQSSLMRLHIVEGALYDSYIHEHEDFCLPGTRTELLSRITNWAKSDDKFIFWLNGMAGTGKSTIARTVARGLEEGLLGATFFFKRGESSRGTATYLITSIAGQLVARHRQLVPEVLNAMKKDPSIASKFLRDQFDQLLYRPLLKMKPDRSTIIVIVIDALDECDGDDNLSIILQLLFKLQEIKVLRLRIVLTSRPELPIRIGFKQEENHQDLILHDIPAPVIESDIRRFLEYKLADIQSKRSLAPDWPGHENIEKLVKIAVPLFISASTACLSIGKALHPQKQLLKHLDIGTTNATQMEKTYLPALRQLMRDDDDETAEILEEFCEIVGVIILLTTPLSVDSLALLLQKPADEIADLLEFLHSVLNVPKSTNEPVRILHLSFRDFLLDTKSEFRIDEREAHRQIALNCLRVMETGLKRNICDLSGYATQWKDINPQIIKQCIPAHLNYSCLYWVYHLQQSLGGISDDDILSFLQKHLLHWLEALALIGELSQAAGLINALKTTVETTDSALSRLLYDAGRFTLQNAHIADIAPMQLYCSGLVFAPEQSVIKKTFISEISKQIQPLPVVMESWSTNLRTLEGHADAVRSVVFSPDGSILASGSFDMTIKIWDTATGTQLQTLEGHSDKVISVAFSPDGSKLASGSADNTIKIWDMATSMRVQIHTQLRTLSGHSDGVLSVAFSPDGMILASGSKDSTIMIWDIATGEQLKVLQVHSDVVFSLAFSPDGLTLASGLKGITQLWDVAGGTQQRTLESDQNWFTSVAFSPDGLTLAMSSRKDIELWDITTGLRRQVLKGEPDYVTELSFSPDGLTLAGSAWGYIELWDLATNTRRQKLDGHSEIVHSVVFAPDGLTLASGSADGTIMFWHTPPRTENQRLDGASDVIVAVVFSPDGVHLASGSSGGVIEIWNAETSALQQTLKGHSKAVSSVLFSPDGRTLASSSKDDNIRLWDTATGTQWQVIHTSNQTSYMAFSPDGLTLASGSDFGTAIHIWDTVAGIKLHTLEGHNHVIHSLAFSPDGITLASCSRDWTVRIWDTVTSALLYTLEGHSGDVLSVAFSIDGLTLASGSEDNTIKIWDTATGMQQQTLEGYANWVTSVAFAPHQLLSDLKIASSDFRISLSRDWVTSGDENILWIPGEYRSFQCQAVQNGKLALGYRDGRVLITGFYTHVK